MYEYIPYQNTFYREILFYWSLNLEHLSLCYFFCVRLRLHWGSRRAPTGQCSPRAPTSGTTIVTRYFQVFLVKFICSGLSSASESCPCHVVCILCAGRHLSRVPAARGPRRAQFEHHYLFLRRHRAQFRVRTPTVPERTTRTRELIYSYKCAQRGTRYTVGHYITWM